MHMSYKESRYVALIADLKRIYFLRKWFSIFFYSPYGLCYIFRKKINKYGIVFNYSAYFERWPKSDGRRVYPVPATKKYMIANNIGGNSAATDQFHSTDFKWVGNYGKLRLELLAYCISCLEDELKLLRESK